MKNDLTRLTNFNISVAVTDTFMQALEADGPFSLIHPKTHAVAKTLRARALMDRIVQSAWQTGEPGLVFIDRINAENVTPGVGEMEATNPCGEVPLLPYEACNLGSLNIGRLITTGPAGEAVVDWEGLERLIGLSVHFLDNVIVQNTFPIEQIRFMVEGNRKIGLGLMGWADALMQLGIPYDSEVALALADDVMAFINYHSKRHSVQLAQERGRFAFFGQSVYTEGTWFQEHYADSPSRIISAEQWAALDADIQTRGLRHATTLCLAPTGTISIIAGASGGIEPLFALAFERNVMDNTRMLEVNPVFQAALAQAGLDEAEWLPRIAQRGSLRGLSGIPETMQQVFTTAYDVTPYWHVAMQAAFQRHSDNAVSKTINFPETATLEEIQETYHLAYRMGLKGITVYRNNSRQAQPMRLSDAAESLMPDLLPTPVDSHHCPECKKPLQRIEGCYQCPDCHYAYCG